MLFLGFVGVGSESPALQSLQSNFAGKRGFEVEFSQEIKQEIFPDQKDRASGRVKFIRPSHLLWTYDEPTKRVISFDGKELKILENEQSQIVRDSGQINLQESFSFLWGQPNPKVFSVTSQGKDGFRVSPRETKRAGFKFIDVVVKSGLVTEAIVENHLDGQSHLYFSHWKLLK